MPSAYRPKHKHDCNRCILLGAHIHEGVWHDLYFCTQGGSRPTVIARWGNDEKYMSGLNFAGVLAPLTVAKDMATRRGLIHAPNHRTKAPAPSPAGKDSVTGTE